MRHVRIAAVEIVAVRGPRPEAASAPRQGQVKPVHVYPEHGHGRDQPPRAYQARLAAGEAEALYVRVGTDAGIDGFYGPIDWESAWAVRTVLAEFLVGQDALAGTIAWDKLNRLDRHGRHGYLKMAISAVDNTLWDLRGKAYDAPVYQLLGGPSRSRIPAYASTLGTSHDPDHISSFAAGLVAEGYPAQKWFLVHGPAAGTEGLEADVAMAEHVRQVVGPKTRLMFDAFMGWDLAHARSFARRVEHLEPWWLEEPFPPSQYPAFVELHRATRVPLSAGEHLYDRADVLPYLRDGVLTMLQCDPEWCGGVTELVRIVGLAETFGVPVIPHGHSVHAALHVVASQSPATCPMVEYLLLSMPGHHHFEQHPPAPVGGSFELPDRPGFGIELDDAKITSRRLV